MTGRTMKTGRKHKADGYGPAGYVGDLLIPRTCLICGRRLYRKEKFLCIYCEADIPLTHYWMRTRNPMADRLNGLIQERITSGILREGPENPPRHAYFYAAALFFYHGESGYKKITQRLKYAGDIAEGRRFASILGDRIREADHFSDIDLVMPVPLHWTRRWKRGYNQAEVIAREIARILGVPVRTDILARTRHTHTQTSLSVERKALNVMNAFAVRRRSAGTVSHFRHILVVDDVFTTGATIFSCFNALSPLLSPEARLSAATLGFVSNG